MGQVYTGIMMVSGGYPDDPDSAFPDFFSCSRNDPPARGRLWYWTYLFYLSKYWELLDTILQVSGHVASVWECVGACSALHCVSDPLYDLFADDQGQKTA